MSVNIVNFSEARKNFKSVIDTGTELLVLYTLPTYPLAHLDKSLRLLNCTGLGLIPTYISLAILVPYHHSPIHNHLTVSPASLLGL
jgi:hypothetical protein